MKARILSAPLIALLLMSCSRASLPALPAPDEKAMLELVARLAGRDDARIAGTEGESAAAELMAFAFRSLGMETKIEEFPILGFRSSEARVELEGGVSLRANALTFSPPTPAEGIYAPIADGGFGFPDELGDAAGKIVLVERGRMFFKTKAENAAAAKALAVIAFDRPREELQATLIEPGPIPVLAIGGAAAATIEESIARHEVPHARVIVRSETFRGTSRNVIARLPGSVARAASAPSARARSVESIVIGAHLDSVGTPGALDNASGLACLAQLARILATADLEPDIYFIAFGAEELGDLGSRRIVEERSVPRIKAMLAIDTVGSASSTTIYSLHGERNIVVRAAVAAAADLKRPATTGDSEASDHAPFAYSGVSAAFLMREPEERYHTDNDSLSAVEGRALVETVELAAGTIIRLARGIY
ncbi:MAG: M28 family peptidase [Spirochaetaceae bacterium]|nr:M28 family peptidase [Spirochaetaceae bacterium]